MEFRLDPIYFNMIKKGDKCVEVRLNDEKRQGLHVGDELTFTMRGDLNQKIRTKVTELHHYKDFAEMVMYEPKKDIGFPDMSLEEIISVYEGFYPQSEQELYGVVAIRFKLI